MKRPTITVCLINDAAYYTDIDVDTVESFGILSARACISKITIIIQRKVHFLHVITKNLHAELPGYGPW